MTSATFQIRIEKINNPSMGFLHKKAQDSLFNAMVNFCIEHFKIDRKKIDKSKLEDAIQVFQVDGTPEDCQQMLASIEHIPEQDMTKVYTKIQNFRLLPSFLRQKVGQAQRNMSVGSFKRLQNICLLFSILIMAEVVE